MKFNSVYPVADGDTIIKLLEVEKFDLSASVQVATDSGFNGTTTRVRLLQSNILTFDLTKWHPLPEGWLTLDTGVDSNLLNTLSFQAKYLAIEIEVGDGTAGNLNIVANFKK